MMLQAGAEAPDLQLSTTDGESWKLAEEVKQGPVVLVFFKISCPTCQLALPFLDRLHQSESAATPRVVGISQDKLEPTREFNRHFGVHFRVALDPAEARYPASNAYRITNVPSLFLVGPAMNVEWSLNGFDRKQFESLGERFSRSPFLAGERVPEMRPG